MGVLSVGQRGEGHAAEPPRRVETTTGMKSIRIYNYKIAILHLLPLGRASYLLKYSIPLLRPDPCSPYCNRGVNDENGIIHEIGGEKTPAKYFR